MGGRSARRRPGQGQPYLDRWRTLWSGRLGGLRLRPEERLAIQCQDFLRLELPLDTVAIHVANESQRSKASWAVQQAMGFLPGFPDTMILKAGGFLFLVEYKAGPNRLTPDQRAIQVWAQAHDIPHVVVRDLNTLIEFCFEHLLVPVDKSVRERWMV